MDAQPLADRVWAGQKTVSNGCFIDFSPHPFRHSAVPYAYAILDAHVGARELGGSDKPLDLYGGEKVGCWIRPGLPKAGGIQIW